MVELRVVDGKIVFAKWKIETQLPTAPTPRARPLEEVHVETEEEKRFREFMEAFGMHQIEAYGFLAYSDEEKDEIARKLAEKGLTFKLTDISPTNEERARASEIDGKVKSRTEALGYIKGEK